MIHALTTDMRTAFRGLLAARVLQSQLHGVQPGEPRFLAAAACVCAACGLFAIWWPSWRASMTDPVLVLKEE